MRMLLTCLSTSSNASRCSERKENLVKEVLVLSILLGLVPALCGAACTWPDDFRSSTWTDAVKGNLEFDISTMAGWDIQVENLHVPVNDWECFSIDAFDTEGYLEMRTAGHITMFQKALYGFLCLKMTKITPVSFRYYLHVPTQERLYGERMHAFEVGTTVTSSCMDTGIATGSEYHVMILSGQSSSAAINCPYVILGPYSFTVTANTVSTCDSPNSSWDMCTETSQMTFNRITCPDSIAFSDTDSVVCVDSVPVGSDHFVTVYNSGPADGVTTFTFSCFGISYDGTRSSVTPRACKANQTPDQIPTGSNGAIVTMTSDGDKCPTCPLLPDLAGGTLLYLTDGATTYATYSCDSQYDLYGAQRRACLQDNTWDLEEPSCKCKAPSPPSNGNVTVSDDGNTATYTCNVGFILVGDDTRICQNNDAWSGDTPTCKSCDTIIPPVNGTYSLLQVGNVTGVVFNCDVGTTMVGSNTSICQTDGSWSANTPSCVLCEISNIDTSGNVTIVTDGMVTAAKFSCLSGYHIEGTSSLHCSVNGDWNGQTPICKCDTPSTFLNGDVSADGSQASYTCQAGFNMKGQAKRYCLGEGQGWNGTEPVCEPCQTLQASNGIVIDITTDGEISSVAFACEKGYTLKGVSVSVCRDNQQWDSVPPDCVNCENLSEITSGSFTTRTDGSVTKVEYTCASGYTLVGEANQTCGTDGKWTSTPPTCKCNIPDDPGNGSIVASADETDIYYFCDIGYSLSATNFIRTCTADGTGWSGEDLTCVYCPKQNDPFGGTAQLDSNGRTTTVTYACNVSYSLKGDTVSKCEAGIWESSNSTCSLCADIGVSLGRKHVLSTSGTATKADFLCELGYSLDGQPSVVCNQDGEWSNALPTCSRCNDKTDPLSGSLNVTSNGLVTKANFKCAEGYYLDGLPQLECLPGGVWNGPDPVCKCVIPSAPANGSLDVLSNGNVIKYYCDIGYTLNGSLERQCGEDGSGWNGNEPSCATCEGIPDTSGGSFTLLSSGSVTEAKYTCPKQSTINGESVITCGTDGSWGVATFPKCETCPNLVTPSSGSVVITTDGSITTAIFSCSMSDYYINGNSEIVCQPDGTWDSSEPSCVCQAPARPLFGNLTISEDRMSASLTCELGYTLNGDANLVCLVNGNGWNGTAPTCVSCPDLTTPTGGNISLVSSGVETKVKYSCDIGSTLDGGSEARCLPNGTWEFHTPNCVSCPTPTEPIAGGVTITTDGITTVATYSCSPGYEVVGSNTTSCQTTGHWEQPNIDCYCIPPMSPDYGNVTISEDRLVALFTCLEGFTLDGVSQRQCLTDGSGWTNTNPSCSKCGTLANLTGGTINLITNGTVTSASASCSEGHTMKGVARLSCQADGSWDINLPECVSCTTVDHPKSGNVSVSTDGTTSTATFTCVSGYKLIGEQIITCGEDGQWSDAIPYCVCNSPANISNGQIYVTELLANYRCDIGYSIDGNIVRQCSNNGTGWSGGDPVCVRCNPLDTLVSGTSELSSADGASIVDFSCKIGASLAGESTLRCHSDGTWTTDIPTCVVCPNLTTISNGIHNIQTNGTVTFSRTICAEHYEIVGTSESYCQLDGSWSNETPSCICKPSDVPSPVDGTSILSTDGYTVSYRCDKGFTLKGNAVRVCQDDNTGWNGTAPVCVSCPALYDPARGNVNITTNGLTTAARYTCNLGSSLNGNEVLVCLDTAEWSSSAATCVQCPDLTNPDSGNVSIETDGLTTHAKYTCVDQYKLVGVSMRTCKTDGSWEYEEPRCTCHNPSPPENGTVLVSSIGLTDFAKYTCKLNFTIKGVSERQCRLNGEFWEGTEPSCVKCQPLSEVVNGQMTFATSGEMTSANIDCALGSSINGSSVLRCLSDGLWDAVLPECTKCQDTPATSNGEFQLESDGFKTTGVLVCNDGYTATGTGSVTCQSDGTWEIVGQQTCSADQEENPLIAALVAVAVVSLVVIAVLSGLLARFVYLYFKRRRSSSDFGDGHYSRYAAVDDNQVTQTNGHLRQNDIFEHPPPKDLIALPLVPFEKTQAPISHQQHVLDRGSLSTSPAPWSHENHVMSSKKSPRGVPPVWTEEDSRTPSQASLSGISIASLPPLPSVIRPPSKSPRIEKVNGSLNSVKLVHKSSKHLVGKQTDSSSSRPMTPVNF